MRKSDFNAGESVRVIGNCYCHHFRIGETVKVVEVKPNGDLVCRAFSELTGNILDQVIAPDCVEKLEEVMR